MFTIRHISIMGHRLVESLVEEGTYEQKGKTKTKKETLVQNTTNCVRCFYFTWWYLGTIDV